jgi:hypothetical protein
MKRAALSRALVLSTALPAVADANCAEDDPCWDGRAMGNHQMGNTLYVWTGGTDGLYLGFPA